MRLLQLIIIIFSTILITPVHSIGQEVCSVYHDGIIEMETKYEKTIAQWADVNLIALKIQDLDSLKHLNALEKKLKDLIFDQEGLIQSIQVESSIVLQTGENCSCIDKVKYMEQCYNELEKALLLAGDLYVLSKKLCKETDIDKSMEINSKIIIKLAELDEYLSLVSSLANKAIKSCSI